MVRIDDPQATLLNQPATFGPGTVAIITDQLTRFSHFWFALLNIQFAIPDGSAITGRVGSDIAEARNSVVAEALEGPSEWVFFIDDDHAMPHEIVMKLLARGVDVVTPLVLRRLSPFWPIATGLDGNFLDIARHGPDELVEVMYAGTSGMLIRRKVLEAVGEPWFDMGYQEDGRRVSEDVNFCKRAAEKGFPIHVDTAVTMTHLTTASVQPVWDEDRWITGVTVADGATLKIGTTPPPELDEDGNIVDMGET